MPRVTISNVKTFSRATAVPFPAAVFPGEINGVAADDHQFANDGRTILVLRNASVDTVRTAEVEFARATDGKLPGPYSYALAAASCGAYGPWPVEDFGSVVKVNVDSSDIKLALLRLP